MIIKICLSLFLTTTPLFIVFWKLSDKHYNNLNYNTIFKYKLFTKLFYITMLISFITLYIVFLCLIWGY